MGLRIMVSHFILRCDCGRTLGLTCPPRVTAGCNATRPAVGKVTTDEWFTFDVVTDRDLSMLGEARHKTIGGRGVVGRLIDKVTK